MGEEKMPNTEKIVSLVIMAILLIGISLAGCKATPAGPKEGVIKIGLLTDLTGPVASSSVPGVQSWEDWNKYVNEQGGIDGHKVELVIFDTRYDKNLAITGFEKMATQDKVNLIWLPGAELVTGIKPLSEKYQIPCTSPTEMALLLPPSPTSYVFGVIPCYADMYRCSLTWIKDNWKKSDPPRIGIMGVDMAVSRSTIKPIKWMLENELKWPVADEEWMTPTATDVTSQVSNLKNAKCDYIVMPLMGAPQLIFQKTAKAAGLMDSSQLIDICIVTITSFRKLDPAATTGVMSHSPSALLSMQDEVPAVAKLVELNKKYRPDAPELDWVRIGNYGAAMAANEAISKAIAKYGYDGLTGANIKWVMENQMNGYNANGLLGPLPWSSDVHAGPHDVILVKTTPNMGLEILKKWQPMPPWPSQASDVQFWK
jgi:branched-chain amino acid transport system substrate-binding protein